MAATIQDDYFEYVMKFAQDWLNRHPAAKGLNEDGILEVLNKTIEHLRLSWTDEELRSCLDEPWAKREKTFSKFLLKRLNE